MKTFIDLFAGTGAFSHVLAKKGLQCVFANDIEPYSKKIYTINNGEDHFILQDLHDIKTKNIPEHDILCAGFPCQPFSIAGEQKGFDDKRSNVFWKILKIIKRRNPKIVILENVKNLTSHDEGKTFKIIIDNLEALNYNVQYSILDTGKITNIPQHRERIYIVCFRDGDGKELNFNFPTIQSDNLKNFLEEKVDNKYYYTVKLKVFDTINAGVVKENTIYQYRRYYVRENKSGLCPTLTANMGGGGHNVPLIRDSKGVRKLTPRECFNLQGFPRDYILPDIADSHLYKLAGNAVSIPVIELLINRLLE